MSRSLGLYIHIPFCRSKCDYCDFYSLAGQEALMPRYESALLRHLEQAAPGASEHLVESVYFGGGTPSLLGGAALARILSAVSARFRLSAGAEITVEANPDSVTAEDLRLLRSAGVNRLSLGVQSARNEELRALNRPHSFEEARSAVSLARQAGFDNLSLDLIYGLPRQSLSGFLEGLAQVLDLEPEHLSCYGLKVEEGTPLFARRESAELPDDEAQAELYLAAVKLLESRGYAQYEISNFARPGKESRHNLAYWTGGAYLGFGPGAHSDFGGLRFAFPRDLGAYLQNAEAGRFPRSEEIRISPEERAREYLMLGLRTVRGISAPEYEARFHRDFSPLEPFLARCQKSGLARLREGRWSLTPQGFLVSNLIIGQLLDIPTSPLFVD